MKRIDVDEPDLGAGVALGLALLRLTLGAIVFAHGLSRLLAWKMFQDEVARLGAQYGLETQYADAIALMAIAFELLGAFGLALGWFTRFASFLVIVTTAFALLMLHLRHGLLEYPELAELPSLMLAASLMFMAMRGGALSVDHGLRKRARRRAIQQDDIWTRPPYVNDARTRDTDPVGTYARVSRH